MPSAKPTTVKAYLASLPEDRREALEALREVILKNLPKGYEEGMQYGMIGYYVPHALYPAGYHCNPKEPVPFASIASQKNHMGLYLFCVYVAPDEAERFRDAWMKTGKKLDMGKGCVRFKSIEEVPLAVVGQTIKRASVKKFLEAYEAGLPESVKKKRGLVAKPTTAKTTKKAVAKPTARQTPTKKKKIAKKPSAARRAKA